LHGYSFKEVMLEEILCFDLVVIRDGIHGGTDRDSYCRWREGETAFDKDVAKSISHTRWLQLKRTYKLCDDQAAPKNEVSHSSALDLCGGHTMVLAKLVQVFSHVLWASLV
jgi:hypothetical protein